MDPESPQQDKPLVPLSKDFTSDARLTGRRKKDTSTHLLDPASTSRQHLNDDNALKSHLSITNLSKNNLAKESMNSIDAKRKTYSESIAQARARKHASTQLNESYSFMPSPDAPPVPSIQQDSPSKEQTSPQLSPDISLQVPVSEAPSPTKASDSEVSPALTTPVEPLKSSPTKTSPLRTPLTMDDDESTRNKGGNMLTQGMDLLRKVNLLGRSNTPEIVFTLKEGGGAPISSVQDRKAKRHLSIHDLSVASSPAAVSPSLSVAPALAQTKTFKEWYPHFVTQIKQSQKLAKTEMEFENTITLQHLFGAPATDAVLTMMAAAKTYERIYKDPVWNRAMLAPTHIRKAKKEKSEDEDDDDDEEEIKYRVLNIFNDGPVEYITYQQESRKKLECAHTMDIVDALIFPLNQGMANTLMFLASFRTYMSSLKLLETLVEWYNVENPVECTVEQEQFLKKHKRAIQVRVIAIFSAWIKHHWLDFTVEEVFKELMFFVQDLAEVSFGDSQKLTQAIREQRLAWYTTIYIPPFASKKTTMSGDLSKPMGLLWDPEELAVQLTHIDHFFFVQIRVDALSHLINGARKDGGSSNAALKMVLEYLSWFRLVSSYVASLIVREDSTRKKVHVLKRWVKIAKECRKLNNFNTLFAILCGLKRPFVAAMAAVWEQLPAKYLETFIELNQWTDPAGGYAAFWAEWKSVRSPAIPFIGAYMQDLLEVHLNVPTQLVNGQINMLKFYDFYSTLSELDKFKAAYPEVLTKTESAVQWGFPQPGGLASSNPFLEYPAYVLTHMREWAMVFMVDDAALDGHPL